MLKYLKLSSIFLCCALLAFSCSKDKIDANEEAFNTALGSWVSVKLVEDGVDITSTASGTFNFKADSTFTSSVIEMGTGLNLSGDFLFSGEGKKLKLTYAVSAGLANYDVLKLTEKELQLSIMVFGKERIADFEKQ